LRDSESLLLFFSEEGLERLLAAIAERRSRRRLHSSLGYVSPESYENLGAKAVA
jgi:transposase InsO family protein